MSLDGQHGPARPGEQAPAGQARTTGLLRQGTGRITISSPPTPSGPVAASGGQPVAAPPQARQKNTPAAMPGWGFGSGSPEASTGASRQPPPWLAKNSPLGLLIKFGLLVVLLGGAWLISRSSNGSTQAPASNEPTVVAGGQGTALPGQVTALPAGPLAIEQVVPAFLAAYFTWNGAESDQAYVAVWARYVTADALAALVKAAPRLSLDDGNDNDARSPAPPVAPGTIQAQGSTAQVKVSWEMQVAPPAADQAVWQPRSIQATVWLTQVGAGWLVSNISWVSRGS